MLSSSLQNLGQRWRRVLAVAGATLSDPRRQGVDLTFIRPCYWQVNRLGPSSVILDFGLGFDADFSQAMIAKYGLTSHGFDPTRRHQPALREIAERSNGRFVLHNHAIGPRRGTATFHESKENVSGSMLDKHPNVQRDTITSYEVEVITVEDALTMSPGGKADLVKMDIEGAEYEVIASMSDAVIRSVPQWIVEFHHALIDGYSFRKTKEYVRRFRKAGFRSFTRDNVNFLFFRNDQTQQ